MQNLDRFKFRIWINIPEEPTRMIQVDHELGNWTCWAGVLVGWGTLMQCTGLKDSDGKFIYEGDVLSWKEPSSSGFRPIRIVKWDNDKVLFCANGYEESIGELVHFSDMVVIGNIYENPELLDG